MSDQESVEKKSEFFDLEKIKELPCYELKQVLNFLDPLHDEEKYQTFLKIYEEKEEPLVQKARLGLRVWSFFYEKLIIRIISLAWVFFAFVNIKKGLNELALNEAEISQQVFTMIVFMGLFVLNLSWRAFVAMYESKKKNFGSMFFRRHLSIRVVGKDGAPISFFRAFLRGLFRLFPLSLFTLMTMEASKDLRGVHDKLFKTYVLQVGEKASQEDIAQYLEQNF